MYYKPVSGIVLEEAKSKIKLILQEGLDNQIISTEEYRAMDPEEREAARFDAFFKNPQGTYYQYCTTIETHCKWLRLHQ